MRRFAFLVMKTLADHLTQARLMLYFLLETERKSRRGRKAVDLLSPLSRSVLAWGFRFLFPTPSAP